MQYPPNNNVNSMMMTMMAGGGGGAPPPSGHTQLVPYMINGTLFQLEHRYTPIKPIGTGAFGVVVSATDHLTGGLLAIKKVGHPFSNEKDAKRLLREIRLMRYFNHANILSIGSILMPASKQDFDDVYFTSELMETDLHNIIKSGQALSEDHVQYFVYQILRGLKHIHSAHVLHRDLKPSNLVVNSDCLLKICDFGLARVANPQENFDGFLTEYVATRWYRAPEVILSWKHYTNAIDVWSVGCIFAELYCRKPLFQGKDYLNQIERIIELLGSPSEEDQRDIGSEQARRFIQSLGFKPRCDFSVLFPNAPPLARDLMAKMLAFNPGKRITVDEALAHPYLQALHDPADEPVAKGTFNFEFENWRLTKEQLKDLVWQEMLAFHPEAQEQTSSMLPPPFPFK